MYRYQDVEIEGMEVPPTPLATEDPLGMGASPFAPLPTLAGSMAGADDE